jgi:hypothetical protein
MLGRTGILHGWVRIRPLVILCFVVVFFSVVSTAKADSIGSLLLSDCGGGSGCPAANYAFDITSTSATLTITINGVPTSSNDFIGSVDLGFTPSSTISGLALTSAPSTLSNWTTTSGSLNSSGACGTNGGAFVCSTALPSNPLPITQGGVYAWTWTYNAIDPALISSAVHVGTQYGPNNPKNPWNGLIVSQTVNTPEPSLLSLMAAGLLALGLVAKKLARA